MVQTSLIPTVLSLSNFFIAHFPNISFYPYWYDGNPYKYLIGPIIPFLLMILKPFADLQTIYLIIIAISLLLGSYGLYLFLRNFGAGFAESIISGLIFFILPGSIALLYYQNGLNHVAFSLLPFILIIYKRYLEKESVIDALLLLLLTTLALLINISIILSIIISLVAISILFNLHKQEEERITRVILIFISAIFLSSVWYGLKFWWVILTNPSFGGEPFYNLVVSIGNSLLSLTPILLAVIFVKWRKYADTIASHNKHNLFAYIFFGSFFILSFIRFISDIDFVLDWTGYVLELQFGLSIILGYIFSSLKRKRIIYILAVTVIAVCIVSDTILYKGLYSKMDQAFMDNVTNLLTSNVKNTDRVFISGSPVFWINSKMNIMQVRGGNDVSSINPYWSHGSYQIRNGSDPNLTFGWMRVFGASYILVHSETSKEYFHDFTNINKYSDFNLIAQNKGDKLFKISNSSVARIAPKKILDVLPPLNGADKNSLDKYTENLLTPIDFYFQDPNKIMISGNLQKDQAISLAITHDSNWMLEEGKGNLMSDSYGNTVIMAKNPGYNSFLLSYKEPVIEYILPLVLSIIFIFPVIFYKRVSLNIFKPFHKLSIGIKEEEY